MHHVEGPFLQDRFDHRQHLKFAWTALAEHDTETAVRIVTGEIRAFAEVRAPGLYHETLTRFWVRLIAHTRAHDEGNGDFDRHLERFPILSDKRAPWKHFSEAALASTAARAEYVEADLLPVP